MANVTIDDLKQKIINKLDSYLDNSNINSVELEVITRVVNNLAVKSDPMDKYLEGLTQAMSNICAKENKDDDVSKTD